jgi:carboxymethylenebutenolidase
MTTTIDYYLSLNSPWVYLGSARIAALAAEHRARLRPFMVDFGGTIFPGSGGLPLARRSPQRQAYRMQELARWRDHLGVPLTLTPKHFPYDEGFAAAAVMAVREAVGDDAAVSLAHRLLRALWAEEANPGDTATLSACIADVGLNVAEVLDLAADPRWSAQRKADSEAALARGVFGTPSYVIGDAIFWGQDRLDFVARHLARG